MIIWLPRTVFLVYDYLITKDKQIFNDYVIILAKKWWLCDY